MTASITIYNYRLYCIEEATFVYQWSSNIPTICPNVHTDRTIDTAQTVIVGNITPNTVIASQDVLKNFQHYTVPMNVPSMTPGDVYTQDFSWPMKTQIWKTELYTLPEHIGDTLTLTIAPNTIVGVLTLPALIGATILTVSSTAVTNQLIANGIEITLDDGVTKFCAGRITAFDTSLYTITVENALTSNFLTGTFVELNYKVVSNTVLHRPNSVYRIGEKGLKGRIVPANTVIRGYYKNVDGNAKVLYITLEIYFE